jgi:uncharacterized protein
MQLNVSQLLKDGVGARRTYTLDETIDPLQETDTTRVLGKVVLTRTIDGVWANGKMKANASGSCIRCLSNLIYFVSFELDEEYLSAIDIISGTPIKNMDHPDGSFIISSQHILDLSEAVRQCVIIREPMKLLCVNDCAGLCSNCGVNLNTLNCHCNHNLDSRWDKLRDFRV